MWKLVTTAAVVLLCACTTAPDVIRTDFTKNKGVYIVGFTPDPAIRRQMEDQLTADLQARNIVAHPSYGDLPDISTTTRDSILRAANAKQTVAVLVINQVVADADGSIDNPVRTSPEHLNLQAFYDYSKSVQESYDSQQAVFAEVNAFLIDGENTRLFWSGTTWSFQADGAGGAIRGISETIANEIEKIRDQMRTY